MLNLNDNCQDVCIVGPIYTRRMVLVSLTEKHLVIKGYGDDSGQEKFKKGSFEEVDPSTVRWGRTFKLTGRQERKTEEGHPEAPQNESRYPTRKGGKRKHKSSDPLSVIANL